MKECVDGYWRLEPKDLEILRFIHEQYLGAFLHFKMLCEANSKREVRVCQRRVSEFLMHGYLEKGLWKEQGIYYFTLSWKGLKALRRREGYFDQLMPLYRLSWSLNQRMGERLKAGLVRMILYELGLRDWTSERVLRERDRRSYPVPTGELKVGDEKIAVHLEEAPKRSLKSYEKLFQDYAKWGYVKVWMIVGWGIEGFLRRMREEFRSPCPQVWLASYENFIRKGAESVFQNHEGRSLRLRDFLPARKEFPGKC